MARKMTLADHAECWCREQGKEVPPRDTDQWQAMYEAWVEWAFSDLHGDGGESRPLQRTCRTGLDLCGHSFPHCLSVNPIERANAFVFPLYVAQLNLFDFARKPSWSVADTRQKQKVLAINQRLDGPKYPSIVNRTDHHLLFLRKRPLFRKSPPDLLDHGAAENNHQNPEPLLRFVPLSDWLAPMASGECSRLGSVWTPQVGNEPIWQSRCLQGSRMATDDPPRQTSHRRRKARRGSLRPSGSSP